MSGPLLQAITSLCLLTTITLPDTAAVTIDCISVGNAADTTGYGAVAYDYNIAKYEVTNTQYAE